MADSDSVSEWIAQLKAGEPRSPQELWNRYADRLIRIARTKIGGTSRRAADEEDVVLSAFDGFFRGVEEARFPKLENRDDLWQILVMLTNRKVIDHRRRELAAKRGGGDVCGESAIYNGHATNEREGGFSQVMHGDPSPEFAALFAEQIEQLFGLLDDDILCKIALGKMEGFTNEELARDLGLNVRSIERKLRLIRRIWQHKEIS